MTELTKVLSIRLSAEDKDALSKYLNRESAEALLRQIRRGEIAITRKGIEFIGVNTKSKSVNTDIEPILEKIKTESPIVAGVNTPDCENCEYAFNALDMTGFDDVCDAKGIDRQKALDKCVSMLWR